MRWKVVITYRSEHGKITVEHEFMEFSNLGRYIENGPDWNTIIDITVTLNRVTSSKITVEDVL